MHGKGRVIIMKEFLCIAVTAICSYLFGSFNSALIVCRLLKHDDIRKYGSKSAGLTNVLRVYGKLPAFITLLCDLFKGVIAVVLARVIVTDVLGVLFFGDRLFIGYVAGVCVVLGHIFPLYYGFKGGKGVLTCCTTMLVVDPVTTLMCLAVFIIVVSITKYVSLGSVSALIVYPFFTGIIQSVRGFNGIWINVAFTALLAVLIVFKHKANIIRLINHEENKLSFKNK